MSNELPASTPPGWYPDPAQAGQQRYWDGTAWTQNVAPGVVYQPVGGYPQSQTSTYALLAIIMAFVFAPLGIVFGVMGRKEIDASGGAKTGRGLATAGMWVGIAGCVLFALYILFIIIAIAGGALTSN